MPTLAAAVLVATIAGCAGDRPRTRAGGPPQELASNDVRITGTGAFEVFPSGAATDGSAAPVAWVWRPAPGKAHLEDFDYWIFHRSTFQSPGPGNVDMTYRFKPVQRVTFNEVSNFVFWVLGRANCTSDDLDFVEQEIRKGAHIATPQGEAAVVPPGLGPGTFEVRERGAENSTSQNLVAWVWKPGPDSSSYCGREFWVFHMPATGTGYQGPQANLPWDELSFHYVDAQPFPDHPSAFLGWVSGRTGIHTEFLHLTQCVSRNSTPE